MSDNFKVGDKVKCITSVGLPYGESWKISINKIYTIIHIKNNFLGIKSNIGHIYFYDEKRFVKVSSEQKKITNFAKFVLSTL